MADNGVTDTWSVPLATMLAKMLPSATVSNKYESLSAAIYVFAL